MKPTPPTLAELKERTLKIEMDHAQAVGLSARDAEVENIRMLERSEQIANAQPRTTAPRSTAPRPAVNERVTKKAAAPEVRDWNKPKQCRCERCIGCLRAKRIVEIMKRGREEPALGVLAKKLMIASLQASAGVGTFAGMSKAGRERRLNACVNEACDASVSLLGGWRKFRPPQ